MRIIATDLFKGQVYPMDLTVIGFIIAVVGIVLQLSNAFPEHKEARQAITVLSVGVFLGILASSLLGAEYRVTGNVDRRFILLYCLVGVSVFFGLLGVLVKRQEQREAALSAAACALAAFILSGFVVAMGSIEGAETYSTEEILLLANHAEDAGQYERAIDRLEQLKRRVQVTSVQTQLQDRIDRLEAAQVGVQAEN